MKLQKFLIGAAVLSLGSAVFAQSIHIGGYVDYSSTLATQDIHNYADEDKWDNSEVAAEFGPVQNGIHFLNLDATAPNVDFHTNVWIGSGLGPWYADVPEYTPGFSVGVVGEIKANDWLSVRLIPTMHFGDKKVVFKEQRTGKEVDQYIKSTYMSIPVDLMISAMRFNNYRPYFVVGMAPVIDLTVKKGKELLMKRTDLMFEVGMGLDLYYPFFKMIPELKFCFGLDNVLEKNRSDLTDASLLKYSQAVDRAQSSMIVLTLYFE